MQKHTHDGHARRHDGRGNPENLVPQFSELAHALRGVDLPQDKQGLRQLAEGNDADEEILRIIDDLPEREFVTMADIIGAAGHSSSHR